MATLIERITIGQRKALTQSYEENKDLIYYIASSMDKALASKATIWAFKNVWNDIISKASLKDTEFSKLVTAKLASYIQRNSALSADEALSRCEELSNSFHDNKDTFKFPNEVDKAVYDFINRIAAPVESHNKKTYILFGAIAAIVVVFVAVLFAFLNSADDKDGDKGTNTSLTSSENATSGNSSTNVQIKVPDIAATLDSSLDYYADIVIKDYGTITVKLEPTHAPITVANFVGLAQSGFYDGLTFHRIIEGFVMQGGDPLGNGRGGSEENIFGEFATNGFKNTLSHTRGAISMARGYENDSASSQFFIMHEDSIRLDGNYAAFGYVTEGMEVVDAVCETAEPVDDNGTILADDQPVIETITIRTEPIETEATDETESE